MSQGAESRVDRYVAGLVQRCQPLVAEDEVVESAWTGKKGLGANPVVMASWFTQPLLVFQSFRVIAVTAEHVYVFKSGWFRRTTPKRLLRTLPRAGAITSPKGRGGFQVGDEALRLDRSFLSEVVDAAARA